MQRHADAMEQARLQSEGTIENLRKKLNTLQDVRAKRVYHVSSLSKRDSNKMEKNVRLTVFNKSNNSINNNYNITIIMIALMIVIIFNKYYNNNNETNKNI